MSSLSPPNVGMIDEFFDIHNVLALLINVLF
jgi:hypothetical protein